MSEREREKHRLFGRRYRSAYGVPLRALSTPRVSWWRRLVERVIGVRCLTCRIKLSDAYWNRVYGRATPFTELTRFICLDRRRCIDCALAEESLMRRPR